jgi:XFP C-terminal domain/Acetokinase family
MYLHTTETQAGSSRTASEGTDRSCILTINGGSSSLKFALFAPADRPERLLYGRVERIGIPGSSLIMADTERGQEEDSEVEAADQAAAVHPYGLNDHNFDTLFTKDKPIIFAYHG